MLLKIKNNNNNNKDKQIFLHSYQNLVIKYFPKTFNISITKDFPYKLSHMFQMIRIICIFALCIDIINTK